MVSMRSVTPTFYGEGTGGPEHPFSPTSMQVMSPKSKGKNSPASERAARVAALQKEAKATERRRAFMLWGAVGLVLVLIIGGVTFAIVRGVTNRPDLAGVQEYPNLGNTHVPDAITYPQSPPVGGDHNAVWLNCGVYEEPVPNWHAVHSLEHGAVWLSYDASLPEDQIDTLRDLASREYMILAPYPDQDAPVKATAWGYQLGVDTAEDPQIEEFIRQYRQSPDVPEPGGACTGGTTTDLVQGG